MKYAWIVAHRERYSTPMMCELLAVSRSGLYQAMHRPEKTKSMEAEQQVGRADPTCAAQAPRALRAPAHDARGQRGAGPGPESQAYWSPDARAWAVQPQAPTVPGK